MPAIDVLFPLGISQYLIGGLFIGFAVSFLFATTGLIGGVSTFFTSTWSFVSKWSYFNRENFVSSRNWRIVYAAGLIIGAAIWMLTAGEAFQTTVSWWQLLLGGFIAGFGARLSNGCTSGHGICGIASLQVPSLLAVLIFLGAAMISANIVQLLGGV
jgi:uncharacterized membrane protein YedE/YeeE